jgi:drug/metabolite transporter (DMT)-like permease
MNERVSVERERAIYGVLPILIAAALWGIAFFLRKTVLDDVGPVYVAAITAPVVAAFLLLSGLATARKAISEFKQRPVSHLFLSLTGTVLGGTLMLIGLHRIDVGVAALLERMQPLFTIIIAYLFVGERFSRTVVPYAVLSLIASYLIAVRSPFHVGEADIDILGLLSVLGAALLWAIAAVIGKRLSHGEVSAFNIVFIRFSVASFITPLLFVLPVARQPLPNFTMYNILIIILTAIMATGIGYSMYYIGLRRIEAGTASFLELITPLVSLALGFLFLSEQLTLSQLLAIPVLLACVYKLSTAPQRGDVCSQ